MEKFYYNLKSDELPLISCESISEINQIKEPLVIDESYKTFSDSYIKNMKNKEKIVAYINKILETSDVETSSRFRKIKDIDDSNNKQKIYGYNIYIKVDELQQTKTKVENDLTKININIVKNNKELIETNTSIDKTNTAITQLKKSSGDQESKEITSKAEILGKLKSRLTKITNQKSIYDNDKIALENKLRSVNEAIDENTKETIKSLFDISDVEYTSRSDSLKSIDTIIDNLNRDAKIIQNKYDKKQNEIESVDGKIKGNEKNLSKPNIKEDQKNRLTDENKNLKQSLTSLYNELQILKTEMETNRTEIAKKEFGELVPYRPYLALKTAQNDIATWNPSTSDCLAEDWFVVE
jgi:chromosome segregation ATPase